MTLIDLFRRFSAASDQFSLSASVRSLYFAMLYEWNERRRTEAVRVSAAELARKAGLPESTYRYALSILATTKLIKIVNKRRGVITFQIDIGAPLRHDCETVAPRDGLLITPARQSKQIAKEESPKGDSSDALIVSEDRANVREHIEPSNNGAVESSGSMAAETSGQDSTNAEIYDTVGGIVVPNFND